MGLQALGGIARVRDLSIDATGRQVAFDALSMRIKFQRVAGNPIRLFFTEDDFNNDVNFWEVGVGEDFDCPIEDRCVWMKGDGGVSTLTMMVLHRKG